jgi:hypothetical protein
LRSCVALLSNFLLVGFRVRCHSLRSLFSASFFYEYRASIGRWGVGCLRGSIPSSPLYYVIEVLNCVLNLGVSFEWNMESKVRRDEVAEIVPVGFTVA